MDGYTNKEYIKFEDDDEDDDEEYDLKSKVKYTILKEEDFDED